MRILITADIHFGHSGRLQDILWSVRTIREYAKRNRINTIMVLGDLFHDRVNLNIETNQAVYKFFKETKEEYGQEWFCFPGNHDMYLKNSWKVTSLHHLSEVMTIVEDIKMLKIGGERFWVVPFVHFEQDYMKVIKALEEKAKPRDVLLTHIGVRGAYFNACFALKDWSVVDFSETPLKWVFTGHFHCHQVMDRVVYPGSPIPFRFDEGMVPHGFIDYDVKSQEFEFIDIKTGEEYFPDERVPYDFLMIDDDHLDFPVYNSRVKVTLTREYTPNELAEIRHKLLKRGALSVAWKHYQEEQEIENIKEEANSLNPESIFRVWVENDQPDREDPILLMELHREVVEEARLKHDAADD